MFEERDDRVLEVGPPLHRVPHERRSVVVSPTILKDGSATEVRPQVFQGCLRGRRLGDREFVLHLPAEPASGVAKHRCRVAAFDVDEAVDSLL